MLFKMVLGGILDRPTARIIKTMASPRDQKVLAQEHRHHHQKGEHDLHTRIHTVHRGIAGKILTNGHTGIHRRTPSLFRR